MLFYFVRHGQTEANSKGLLAGSGIDHPLNEAGHGQARALASDIRRLVPHKLHRLIASSMTRAQETAKYIAPELGLPVEVNADFREWHLGEWEGQPYQSFLHLLLGEGEPLDGESRAAFYGRVHSGWKRVHSESEPYLIVAHGAVWLAMQDNLKIPRFKVSNCDLVRVEYFRDRWYATILNG
jgi:probable phosphoglycerate mutase